MFRIRPDFVRDDFVFFLNRLRQISWELFFPGRCILCKSCLSGGPRFLVHDPAHWVCSPCLESQGLFQFEEPYCILCGQRFSQGPSHVCQDCLRKTPVTGKVRSAFWYQGLMEKLIPLMKYQHKLCLTPVFENALFQAFCRYFSSPEPDVILPIPLHRTRLFSRRFNQAYLMVRNFPVQYHRCVGTGLRSVIDVDSLRRVRATKYQTGTDRQARNQNVKHAFGLASGAEERIRGRYVLLVDDVYTSGATCREAAAVLLRAGAARVDVLTLARA